MKLTKKKTIVIATSKITKEFKDFEYEIKLECLQKDKLLSELLNLVEVAFNSNTRYQMDKVQIVTKMISHFLVDTKNEYSVFRYNGKVMLKIKQHHILHSPQFPIFKNKEYFIYDGSEIINKLKDNNIIYVGSMIKHRIKDFIIDREDGRVYSLAITICETSGQLQHQLEVEYYGYLSGYEKIDKNNESEIIGRLSELSNFIYKTCRDQFLPSIERKYEFVSRYKTVSSLEAAQRKIKLLNNMEAL